MRLFKFILLFFIVSSCTLYETRFSSEVPTSSRNLASIPSKEAHIVFDLDWTLVTPLKVGSEKPFIHTGHVFVVEGHPYLLKEGMIAILEASLQKVMNVSFFSGGKRSRNINLLKIPQEKVSTSGSPAPPKAHPTPTPPSSKPAPSQRPSQPASQPVSQPASQSLQNKSQPPYNPTGKSINLWLSSTAQGPPYSKTTPP